MLIFGYRLRALRLVVTAPLCGTVLLPGLHSLLGYRNYYAIHGSPYTCTSAHILIENTLVCTAQKSMAKNSRMALYCQNRVSKGTGRRYGLHSNASISGHSTFVTVLGLLKKEEEEKKKLVQNGVLAVFRLAT